MQGDKNVVAGPELVDFDVKNEIVWHGNALPAPIPIKAETDDKIENLGIDRTINQAKKSSIIIYLFDGSKNIENQLTVINNLNTEHQDKVIKVINKIDTNNSIKTLGNDYLYVSAKENLGIDELKNKIFDFTNINALDNNNTIVTNQRHYEQLKNTLSELEIVIEGLNNGVSGDLLAR